MRPAVKRSEAKQVPKGPAPLASPPSTPGSSPSSSGTPVHGDYQSPSLTSSPKSAPTSPFHQPLTVKLPDLPGTNQSAPTTPFKGEGSGSPNSSKEEEPVTDDADQNQVTPQKSPTNVPYTASKPPLPTSVAVRMPKPTDPVYSKPPAAPYTPSRLTYGNNSYYRPQQITRRIEPAPKPAPKPVPKDLGMHPALLLTNSTGVSDKSNIGEPTLSKKIPNSEAGLSSDKNNQHHSLTTLNSAAYGAPAMPNYYGHSPRMPRHNGYSQPAAYRLPVYSHYARHFPRSMQPGNQMVNNFNSQPIRQNGQVTPHQQIMSKTANKIEGIHPVITNGIEKSPPPPSRSTSLVESQSETLLNNVHVVQNGVQPSLSSNSVPIDSDEHSHIVKHNLSPQNNHSEMYQNGPMQLQGDTVSARLQGDTMSARLQGDTVSASMAYYKKDSNTSSSVLANICQETNV